MARINIEEEFWFDPRRRALEKELGDFEALGQILTFWRMVQEQYKIGKCITEDQFKIIGLSEKLFEVGFAVRSDAGITIPNIEKHFGWLLAKKESGRIGGLKSGISRVNKINNLTEAKRSKLKQTEPSTSTSTSTSKNTNPKIS